MRDTYYINWMIIANQSQKLIEFDSFGFFLSIHFII